MVIIIFFSYDSILLSNLGVSNGSIREVFSIPFMQLARTVKYHRDEFTENEINKINKVLDFELISIDYNPDISDGVKNTYKKDCTKKDLYNLFDVWFKYLKKYPLVYIDSFFNSTYKYYYPLFISENIDISKHYYLEEEFPSAIDIYSIHEVFNNVLLIKYKSLFTVYFNTVGIISWILIFTIVNIIKNKRYKYLIPLSPLVSVILVALASPLNGSPRYILPLFFSVPIILFIISIVNEEKNKKIN